MAAAPSAAEGTIPWDRWPDTSLLVAATNHPHLLDKAVERRFDRRLALGLPTQPQRRAILDHLAADVGDASGEALALAAELTEEMNSSDLTRLWALARRRSILNDSAVTDELVSELARRCEGAGPGRDRLFLMMRDGLGMSNRRIAALTGVSHPTVASGVRRAEGDQHGEPTA